MLNSHVMCRSFVVFVSFYNEMLIIGLEEQAKLFVFIATYVDG